MQILTIANIMENNNTVISHIKDLPDNPFLYFEQTNKKSLFFYGVLFTGIFYFITSYNITLTLVFAIISGIIIIVLVNKKELSNKKNVMLEDKYKLSLIIPAPKYFDNYPEIIDFFYSIQWVYPYSPKNYRELINSTDELLLLYEDMQIGVALPNQHYDVAIQHKQSMLNSLHAILYSLPSHKVMDKTIFTAIDRLHQIINKYVFAMASICNKSIDDHGYTATSKHIDLESPNPVNYYDENILGHNMY